MNNSYQKASCLTPAGVGVAEQGQSSRSLIRSAFSGVTAVVTTGIWLTACSSQAPVPNESQNRQLDAAAEQSESQTTSPEHIYPFEKAHQERYGDKFMSKPTDDSTGDQSE